MISLKWADDKADAPTTGFKEIMYKTPRPTVDFNWINMKDCSILWLYVIKQNIRSSSNNNSLAIIYDLGIPV